MRTPTYPILLAILLLLMPGHSDAKPTKQTIRVSPEQVHKVLPEHIGASVLVMDRGRVVFRHSYGTADIETGNKVSPATNFRIASVTKQFTATAIMLLVDDNKLALDDTLDKFFPGLPGYAEKITVRHVLNHTSGLPDYENLIPQGTTLQVNDLDVLRLILDTDTPMFEPGAQYHYSNTGYALLGLIVEQVADQPFHGFVAQNIFKPCSMNRSVFFVRGLNDIQERAFGHTRKDGQWVRNDQSVTSAVRGDGGIYSSIDDLARWVASLDRGSVLSKSSARQMYTPGKTNDGKATGYGFGWRLDTYRGQKRVHHTGSTRGFTLCLQRFPERKAAVIVLINNSVGKSLTPTAERISDLLLFADD